jgi:hypothetical protein
VLKVLMFLVIWLVYARTKLQQFFPQLAAVLEIERGSDILTRAMFFHPENRTLQLATLQWQLARLAHQADQ